MRTVIGAIILLIGIIYVVGAIFHRMIWILAKSLTPGIMLACVVLGAYLLLSGLFKKGK
jgi:hypothetical protein